MFVIARNSVFTYKGKPVKIKQVSEELGVRYVLEGSVQREGDRLRINAQLIDALKGHHLWAERYDRELQDLFALQDEITMKILNSLEVKLTVGEVANWYRTDIFEAWSHLTKGFSLLNRLTKEDLLKARKHFEQAANLEPDYAPAWSMQAWTDTIEVLMGFSKSRNESISRAIELAQKSAALGEDPARIYSLMGRIYRVQGKFDKAIAEGKKAVALIPNEARTHIFLAGNLHYGGKPQEAIVHANKAMRLEPYYPAWFLIHLAGPYEMLGRYEEAIAIWKELLERARRGEFPSLYVHERLVRSYVSLGRIEEAQAHASEILKIKPDYTVEFYRQRVTKAYKDQAYVENSVALLRKAGLPEHPPPKLPDKPSIAVLPFENLSGDPEQDYFSDGLTRDIITALSTVPRLFVIASDSTFTYKGKSAKVQQVAEELGVRYVLEGSVRQSEDRVRITAQLIDATNGRHLWAEKYDRNLEDIFAVQDEITNRIFTSLQVKLTEGEQARIWRKATNNIRAYEKYITGLERFRRWKKEDNLLARHLWTEAIEIDPQYALAYVALAYTHSVASTNGWSKTPEESLLKAEELAQKALALDDSFADTYTLLGNLAMKKGQYDEAVNFAEKAITLNPGQGDVAGLYAMYLSAAGRQDEAIAMFKQSIRLNSIAPAWVFEYLGRTYILAGKYEDAIEVLKKILSSNHEYFGAHIFLAAAYSLAGHDSDARASAEEALKINPEFSLEVYGNVLLFKEEKDKALLMNAMRKAGLK